MQGATHQGHVTAVLLQLSSHCGPVTHSQLWSENTDQKLPERNHPVHNPCPAGAPRQPSLGVTQRLQNQPAGGAWVNAPHWTLHSSLPQFQYQLCSPGLEASAAASLRPSRSLSLTLGSPDHLSICRRESHPENWELQPTLEVTKPKQNAN